MKLSRSSAVLVACAVSACTSYGPAALQQGADVQSVTASMGPPTAETALPDGGRRLEFARGPYGKHTYMLDFDAQGRLLQSSQVLTETTFASVQAGMTADQVRQTLGRPARVWGVRYHNQTVWSYRYDTPFCQLFH